MSLIEYIKGQRHGKGAHDLERESMQDPFLSDAIDGFDSVEGSHIERIGDMRSRVSHRIRRPNRRLAYISIAASLLVFVTIGGDFIFDNNPKDIIAKGEYSSEKEVVNEQVRALPSVKETPIVVDEIVEEEAQMERDIPQKSRKPENGSLEMLSASEDLSDEVVISGTVATKSPHKAVTAKVNKADEEEGEGQAQAQAVEDLALIAGVTQDNSENAVTAEPQELRSPVSSSSDLTRAATSQESKKATRLETPEPKIGWRSYRKYLKDSLRPPSDGDCAKLKGVVEVTFHIDKEGRPYDFVIGKSLCSDADAEAIRLVKEGSLWTCESFRRMTVEVKF